MIQPGVPVQQPNQSSIAKATDFGAGMLLALYLFAVIYEGNMRNLIAQAVQDGGYLEWLVAIVILYEIYKLTGNKVIASIIGLAVVAVLIKLTKNNSSVASAVSAYGQGKQGLFATIAGLGSSNAPAQPTTAPSSIQLPQTQTNTVTPVATNSKPPTTNNASWLPSYLLGI